MVAVLTHGESVNILVTSLSLHSVQGFCQMFAAISETAPNTTRPAAFLIVLRVYQLMLNEYAFEMAASAIRFGSGATREVGADLVDLGARKALVLTDPNLRNLPPVTTALESIER